MGLSQSPMLTQLAALALILSGAAVYSRKQALIRRNKTAQVLDPVEAPCPISSPEHRAFERLYLIIYILVMGADWLQGPYVFQLYSAYGYSQSQIATLFVIGFASSMLAGTYIGSLADRYGRRSSCQLFAVLYCISCLLKHGRAPQYLIAGRIAGGISTSILFSSFEAWLVKQHHAKGYPSELLPLTFSKATTLNGIVAIVAGVIANYAYDVLGPVGPFDTAALLLCISLMLITAFWDENYGDQSGEMNASFAAAVRCIVGAPRILLLGVSQSLFESAMYIFVFMWTPALGSSTLEHGLVFACFMVCTMIGSTIFSTMIDKQIPVERFAPYIFSVASCALLVPAFFTHFSIRLFSFFVFEVCCGLYWPSFGTMRGKYIPDEIRSTIMNLFRLPLNFIVVCTLLFLDRLSQNTVWLFCSAMLATASIIQAQLKSDMFNHNDFIPLKRDASL